MHSRRPSLLRAKQRSLCVLLIEKAELRPRAERVHPSQAVAVEGRIHHAVAHPVLIHQGQALLLDPGIGIHVGLQLNIQQQAAGRDKLEHLAQRRDGLPAETPEFKGIVVLLELADAHRADLSGPARTAVDLLIMADHQFPVPGKMDIQLDPVRLHMDSLLEGSDRVFRCIRGCAPVRPYQHFCPFSLPRSDWVFIIYNHT